ncbi:MAG: transcription antitermination factor NusB [Planctomycetota bacterium]|jgi:16S rRNA (cytosine967-C5)-methyltransferase
MAEPEPKTGRQIAYEVLSRFEAASMNAREILHSMIHKTEHKAQATDLVFGVIRNRAAIDMLITRIGGTPVERIRQKLIDILRIGTYELAFVPKTPEYAIVNEAANLAGTVAGKKHIGFVNAVLRNITRGIADREVTLANADTLKTLPQSPQAGCLFKYNILPDPKAFPADYLSKAFSLPVWLVTNWLDEFGPERTTQICFGSNRRPGVFLWANTLRITPEALTERFEAEGIEFEADVGEPMLKLKSHQPVFKLSGFDEGLFFVQDPTAAKAVQILGPRPGWIVLDVCAAPGGKTVQMARLMGNTGRIIATDIDPQRLEKVDANCKRLGVTIVETIEHDRLAQVISKIGRCDAVLLDVPCSNTGVLARRPEVRLRVRPKAVASLAQTQLQLLEKVANSFNPDTCGRGSLMPSKICYSTCSIMKQENKDVVTKFLSKNPDFNLESEDLVLPSSAGDRYDRDGGYIAIIRKA